MEANEDWYVDCSDDEKYSHPGGEKGVWEPDPKDIKEMYEKLAAGEELTFAWSWPRGRRSPTPERADESMEEHSVPKEAQKEEKQAPTAFDFDDFSDGPLTALTPRRTPGAKTPRSSQKRVARMDKIMDDLRKEKKSMSPGQRTMVPGHRPLPGLGGANRMTAKSGVFGAGGQRSPGAALSGAGIRAPAGPRGQTPGAAGIHAQTASLAASRPPLNTFSPAPGATATSSVVPKSSAGYTAAPASGAAGSNTTTSPATPTGNPNAEQTRPTQAVTLVPPAEMGTPQRPVVPKLKIRKDLIS